MTPPRHPAHGWPGGEGGFPGSGDGEPGSRPGDAVAPSREDPVVRAASQVIGGPAGARLASATGLLSAVTVLVAMAMAVLAFGVVTKQHCRAQGWTTPDQFWHACYSDIPVLYGSSSLGGPDRPSLGDAIGSGGLGQPPLSSTAMWLVSALVPGGEGAQRQFFDVSVLLLAGVLAVTVAAVAVAAGRRKWDAAQVAASPVLVTAGLISYQLLAIALLALAFVAWRRDRPVLGGVALGLAALAAPPLMVAAVGIGVVVATARTPRAEAGWHFALGGVVAWFVARVILFADVTAAAADSVRGWWASPPGYGSLWLVPQLLEASRPSRRRWWWPFDAANSLGATTASALSLITIAAVITFVTVYVLRRPVSPTTPPVTAVARLALVLLAVTMVLSTSLPVQASLLLLPLIALAGLPWRDHLIWATTEVVYFMGVWLYIAAQSDPNRGLPAGFYLAMLAARLAGITWVGVQALLLGDAEAGGSAGAAAVRPQQSTPQDSLLGRGTTDEVLDDDLDFPRGSMGALAQRTHETGAW